MKRYNLILVTILCVLPLSHSCGKMDGVQNNEENSQGEVLQINRSKIYGCWKIVRAKFAEDAIMSAWPYQDTYSTFQENGIYGKEGYYGKGTGTYSIKDNVISVLIDGQPYIDYTISEQKDSLVSMCATFRSNGVKVWMECTKVKILDEENGGVVTIKTIFDNEENSKVAVLALYAALPAFAKYQLAIEQKIITGKSSTITPESDEVFKLWQTGYSVIHLANVLVSNINAVWDWNRKTQVETKYLPHILAVRAYVYYNMAMLWGNIPLITEDNMDAALVGLPRSSTSDVYSKAINDLLSCKDNIVDFGTYGNSIFSSTAAQMLLTELYLTIGNAKSAGDMIDKVGSPSNQSIFNIIETEGTETINVYAIYVKAHPALLKEEAVGNAPTLVSDWQSAENADFGYWAMLKRTGNAIKTVGCQEYQKLLPIPQAELRFITQNPGY